MNTSRQRDGRLLKPHGAIDTTKITPVEVVTDKAATYPIALDELLPATWHRTTATPTTTSRPTTAV
jgi:hypothetical protein